jgi:SpoIID/LytB domain protein
MGGRRIVHALTAGLCAMFGLGIDVPAKAAPPSTITLYGHGWGHGRGMGQYGAQGYASLYGWSSQQILAHFYQPTQPASVADQVITVRLIAQDGAQLDVTSGAAFTIAGSPHRFAAGQALRLRSDAVGNVFASGMAGCGGAVYGWVQLPAPVTIVSSVASPGDDLSRMLRTCGGRTYRGQLAFLHADGAARTVNAVNLEDYLRGVVPRESPSWFAPAALQAQAVAARSYALAEGGEFGQRFGYAKTCDSIACQVYGGAGLAGTPLETPAASAAVAATRGIVRRFPNGTLARTEYSSSTGGFTAGGAFAAVADLGDAVPSNPRHDWTRSIATNQLAARYGLGTFVGLNITARNGLGDWGGRVLQLQVVGTARTVTLSGPQFQSDWGLFSSWFNATASGTPLLGPTAVSPGPGRVDVFSVGSDAGLWHRTETAASLGSWQRLGGIITSDADAASWSGDRLDVFGRGGNASLWHKAWTPASGWVEWEDLSGILTSGPSAVSWGPNRIDVFGRGGDGALWTRAWNGSTWTQWRSLGGYITSDPDVASWGPNRLDIFALGGDAQMWHMAWTGAGWSAWQPLGGRFSSGPGAVSWGPNRIDVYARGLDGALWTSVWNGARWTPWSSIGGAFFSGPDLASWGPNRLDIVARGTDNAVWQNSWSGATFSGWFRVGPLPG